MERIVSIKNDKGQWIDMAAFHLNHDATGFAATLSDKIRDKLVRVSGGTLYCDVYCLNGQRNVMED